MDKMSPEQRSAIMAKIRSRDTKPEWLVRRYLFKRGYRYRKNVRGLPGTPDIVMRKYGIVIFIHGCFWHGHGVDGTIPRTNTAFWQAKIRRNQDRDERNKQALRAMGWNVLTIWECQLKPAVRRQTLLEMEYFINHSYLERVAAKRRSRTAAGNAPLPYGPTAAPTVAIAAEPQAPYQHTDADSEQ